MRYIVLPVYQVPTLTGGDNGGGWNLMMIVTTAGVRIVSSSWLLLSCTYFRQLTNDPKDNRFSFKFQ